MRDTKWIHRYSSNKLPKTPDEILEILFKNRNLTDLNDINIFLNPQIKAINYDIGDIQKAVERLQTAIEKKEKIIVYGDYDADGVTATAIMWEALHALGANAKPYIPHREKEGYGMSNYGIDYLLENEQVQLIVTVDQGISAKKQIDYAQSKGIEVIVTDHHTKPAELPENCLIIHDHTVSGAAVAWKVAQKLIDKYDDKVPKEIREQLSNSLLELAAIGIICDLIPLKNDARAIVHHGIQLLKKTSRPGLRAITNSAGSDLTTLDTYHIGYIIGPRINATGRLEHAMDSLRLLCTKNQLRANDLAQKVQNVNNERKELTTSLVNEARQQAQYRKNDPIIIVGNKDWNPGIIGLVASKIVEEFYRPTIVWGTAADKEHILKASARSIKGFNIIDSITNANQYLLNFGGHPMAAGFSIESQNLQDFEKHIKSHAEKLITEDILQPFIDIDCEIPFESAVEEVFTRIQQLKPFGIGAEEPIFTTSNVIVKECRAIGTQNKHLKMNIGKADSKETKDAIAFNMGEFGAKLRPGDSINIAYTLDMNEWNGKKSLQYKIKDIHLQEK